jgi:polyhydroxybutyrate depolymerase
MNASMQLQRLVLVSLATLVLAACSDGDDPVAATGETAAGNGGGGGSSAGGDAGTAGDAGDSGGDAGTAGAAGTGAPPETLGPEDRLAGLFVPTQHDGVTKLPLVVLLHGYGAAGGVQSVYFGAPKDAERAGYYLITPDGMMDGGGRRFWNATPFCCDFEGTDVDDVAYLTGLLDEAIDVLSVDEDRVYSIGHSNGGFMSYRMACELSDRVAAIMSLAGADFSSDEDCVPTQAVSVLQVHGDADETISFEGTAAYTSALDSAKRWALRAGCDDTETEGEMIDLESKLEGAETVVTEWKTGCEAGHDAALWRIAGGGHLPVFEQTNWMPAVSDWLLSHKR